MKSFLQSIGIDNGARLAALIVWVVILATVGTWAIHRARHNDKALANQYGEIENTLDGK